MSLAPSRASSAEGTGLGEPGRFLHEDGLLQGTGSQQVGQGFQTVGDGDARPGILLLFERAVEVLHPGQGFR